ALALGDHGPHTNGNQFFIVQNTKAQADLLM
ncbi:TPA: peptidylprolyl isomerase, partial [Enterococcus faecium]